MQAPVLLGLAPALFIHASGALTYCGREDAPPAWDDEPLLAVAA